MIPIVWTYNAYCVNLQCLLHEPTVPIVWTYSTVPIVWNFTDYTLNLQPSRRKRNSLELHLCLTQFNGPFQTKSRWNTVKLLQNIQIYVTEVIVWPLASLHGPQALLDKGGLKSPHQIYKVLSWGWTLGFYIFQHICDVATIVSLCTVGDYTPYEVDILNPTKHSPSG